MIYIRKDIPSKELKYHNFTKNVEAIFVEVNMRKRKLLLCGTYHSTHALYGTTNIDFFEQIGLLIFKKMREAFRTLWMNFLPEI